MIVFINSHNVDPECPLAMIREHRPLENKYPGRSSIMRIGSIDRLNVGAHIF